MNTLSKEIAAHERKNPYFLCFFSKKSSLFACFCHQTPIFMPLAAIFSD